MSLCDSVFYTCSLVSFYQTSLARGLLRHKRLPTAHDRLYDNNVLIVRPTQQMVLFIITRTAQGTVFSRQQFTQLRLGAQQPSVGMGLIVSDSQGAERVRDTVV